MVIGIRQHNPRVVMVRLCPVQINFYDLMLDVIGQMALRDYSRAFLEKIENLYGWAFMAKI